MVTTADQAAFDRYAAELAERARVDREIALLKVAAPGMCGLDDNDLMALAEVFHG